MYDVDGSIYGKGAVLPRRRQHPGFNQRDPKRVGQLLKEAGYKGEPIRLLTSKQFDYFYKQTLVAKENLQKAGFKVDVQVMDWASVTQKRTNANEWEGFIAYHRLHPRAVADHLHQSGISGLVGHAGEVRRARRVQLGDGSRQAPAALEQHPEAALRAGVDADHRALLQLTAVSDRLQGFTSMPQPAFWNVRLAQ